jgi:hypothetical protein
MEEQAERARGDILPRFLGARQDIGRGTTEAISALRGGGDFAPFAQQGAQASNIQAALTGALGPEAQQQAFTQFQADPGQEFLREQGEESILRTSAATGGLGGGNVRRALTRFGTGLAQQGLQQRLQNLGGIAGRGLQAAGAQEGRAVNIANLLAGRGQQQAGQQTELARLLAGVGTAPGLAAAQLPSAAGRLTGQGFLQPIAQAAEGIGTAIAASDSRLKTNIQKTGETPSGINLYTWDWTEEGKEIVGDQIPYGVMAQEILEMKPEAVIMFPDGYYRVDYARIH